MILPTNLHDFLLLVIAQPLALGAVVAFLCQAVFSYWEAHTGQPIRAHDKTLVTTLAPPLIGGGLWAIAAGLGFVSWSWADAAQAVYNGVLASVGGQALYAGFKKVLSPPPPLATPNSNMTNSNTITAGTDANLSSTVTHTEEHIP